MVGASAPHLHKILYLELLRLEILEDLPDVDTIFVSVGGGGLISGIATYIKAIRPSVKVLLFIIGITYA